MIYSRTRGQTRHVSLRLGLKRKESPTQWDLSNQVLCLGSVLILGGKRQNDNFVYYCKDHSSSSTKLLSHICEVGLKRRALGMLLLYSPPNCVSTIFPEMLDLILGIATMNISDSYFPCLVKFLICPWNLKELHQIWKKKKATDGNVHIFLPPSATVSQIIYIISNIEPRWHQGNIFNSHVDSV